MTLYGVALVPQASDTTRLIKFRTHAGAAITGPMLGHRTNLPHVSLLQCPFHPDALTTTHLTRILTNHSPTQPVLGLLGRLYQQPVGWVFADITTTHPTPHPWCGQLQQTALNELAPLIRTNAIDHTRDTSQYSPSERAAYHQYGYRYAGPDAFRPHITLGRTTNPQFPTPALTHHYQQTLAGHPITFDRIVWYRAGEHGALADILAEVPLPR